MFFSCSVKIFVLLDATTFPLMPIRNPLKNYTKAPQNYCYVGEANPLMGFFSIFTSKHQFKYRDTY